MIDNQSSFKQFDYIYWTNGYAGAAEVTEIVLDLNHISVPIYKIANSSKPKFT